MKHIKIAFAASVALVASGCTPIVGPQTSTYNIQAPFDASFAKDAIASGDGLIEGSGFALQRGGGVVTCAGRPVRLIPVTDYATERLYALYGHAPAAGETVSLPARVAIHNPTRFEPDLPEYRELSRETKCDAQGKFRFRDVKDGSYYLNTMVAWEVARAVQGQLLATKVVVTDGKAPDVILSDD